MLSKTVVRRGSIILVCVMYYLTLGYYDLIFMLQHQTYTSQGGDFTGAQSLDQANTLLALHQDTMYVAWIGLPLCLLLILYIHKKVR